MADNQRKLQRVLDLVSEAVVDAAPQWAKATTRFQVKNLRNMIAQEEAIAFALICSNIGDSGCAISPEAYRLLQEVGQTFVESPFARAEGISRATWEELKGQIE